jgi:hypothetical protein
LGELTAFGDTHDMRFAIDLYGIEPLLIDRLWRNACRDGRLGPWRWFEGARIITILQEFEAYLRE